METPLRVPKMKPIKTSQTICKKGVKEDAVVLVEAATQHTDEVQIIEETHVVPRQVYESAVENFVEMVGGRAIVIDVLLLTPPELQYASEIHRLAIDAATHKTSISDLAVKHRVPIAALIRAYREALLLRTQVETIHQIAGHVGEVARQTAEDAKNRYTPCIKCKGIGKLFSIQGGVFVLDSNGERVTQLCWGCNGTGEVYKEHTPSDRAAVLKMAKVITDDRAQTVVNVNNQTANLNYTPGDGAGESLIKAVHKILYQTAKSEAEVIDA